MNPGGGGPGLGGDVSLGAGDGAGFTTTDALEFLFDHRAEVLLVDVRMDVSPVWE